MLFVVQQQLIIQLHVILDHQMSSKASSTISNYKKRMQLLRDLESRNVDAKTRSSKNATNRNTSKTSRSQVQTEKRSVQEEMTESDVEVAVMSERVITAVVQERGDRETIDESVALGGEDDVLPIQVSEPVAMTACDGEEERGRAVIGEGSINDESSADPMGRGVVAEIGSEEPCMQVLSDEASQMSMSALEGSEVEGRSANGDEGRTTNGDEGSVVSMATSSGTSRSMHRRGRRPEHAITPWKRKTEEVVHVTSTILKLVLIDSSHNREVRLNERFTTYFELQLALSKIAVKTKGVLVVQGEDKQFITYGLYARPNALLLFLNALYCICRPHSFRELSVYVVRELSHHFVPAKCSYLPLPYDWEQRYIERTNVAAAAFAVSIAGSASMHEDSVISVSVADEE